MQMIYKAILLGAITGTSTAYAMLPTPELNPTNNPTATTAIGTLLVQPATNSAHTAQAIKSSVYGFLVRPEGLLPITNTTVVQSGDIIEYHGYFTNQSSERIRSVIASIDIPNGVELIGNIAPRGAMASVNGTNFGFVPLQANINGQIQQLPLSNYKALRWQLEDLGIGGTAVVQYRARLK